MLLSLKWLRDYLQKPDVKIDIHELAEKLTMRGLPVASVNRSNLGLENVVVGRIERIEKHPNADRLQVTHILTSDEPNTPLKQIVCGAKNIAVGDIVPVALPGCVLPGNFEIKISAIRGVESSGMLCSGKELGIAEDSEGILQLPKHSTLGQSLSRLLGGAEDTVVEFELTPNRFDCLSVLGLGREIAPLLNTKVRDPKPARFRNSAHRTSSIVKVEVSDPNLCPRYVARVIDSFKVTESPDWIKQRLQAVNIRPINNIVDITNFTMMEYGQPLHAFDLRKIESGTVRVGECQQEQDFVTLTGESVRLMPGDILILDGDRPIAIAGIMGGANSQVEADTTSIVLESAAFPAHRIRRTAQRLGLHTESAKRFEKGSDLAAVLLASERAAALLRDSFNANVYHPPIDTNETAPLERSISVDMRDIKRITGMKNLTAERVSELLDEINVSSHRKSVNVLSVRLPSFRPDLQEPIDVVEEVVRLAGYDSIPLSFPSSSSTYDRLDESQYEFEQKTRQALCSFGMRETIHYSFTSSEKLTRYGVLNSASVKIKNPISEEMAVMRTSLLPSLVDTYLFNKNRKVTDMKFFEVANTYQWNTAEETRVRETPTVAGLISGGLPAGSWNTKPTPVDFFHVKGLVCSLIEQLTTVQLTFEPPRESKLFHPKRSAILKLGLKDVGWVGEIHPFVREHILETEESVVLFEVSLEALKKYERPATKYRSPSKFPAIDVDLAFLVDKPVTGHSLMESIRSTGGDLLATADVFDVYEGDKVAEGKKSVGFRLSFQSTDRTLQDDEVNGLKNKIIQTLSERFGASLRS